MAVLPGDVNKPAFHSGNGPSVLIVTAHDVEDLEFFYPYYRFIEAGYTVDVTTPDGGAFKGKHGIELRDSMKIIEADADDYQLLYLPGGKAPAKLKKREEVQDLVRDFFASGKIISAICHGPQILAAAGVIRGRKITAWPEIEDEVAQAGGHYVNAETVVDGPFITARWPGDLPMHLKRTMEVLHQAQRAGMRMVS